MISNVTGVTHSEEQLKILNHRGGMCIIACAGSGKALKNGTRVLTPTGYRPIEKLKVGDEVFDEKGKVQKVVGVYPQGKKQVHKVKFDNIILDETVFDMFTQQEIEKAYPVIECCGEHLWSYIAPSGKLVTKTASQMMEDGQYEVYKIPTNKSVITYNKDATFSWDGTVSDPYILALFRNAEKRDGGYRVNISYMSKDVLSAIKMWFTLNEVVATVSKEHESRDGSKYIYFTHACSKLIEEAKAIKYSDVLHSHHFFREHFMNGIQDTSKNVKYTIDEILELNSICHTLGYAIKFIRKEKKGNTWTRLERVNNSRKIISIELSDEQEEMTCISVTGPRSLYLTENTIATHNTTVLTHLLAKRAMTGEIPNLNKLLCTTYSKAGSTEMGERLGNLLKSLGINTPVEVKTMHATYYKVLRHFGIASNVCSSTQRNIFINQAVKEVGLRLEEENLQLLDSLLSYQVNNLLDDTALGKSYVYTLEDVPIETYSKIRMLYNKKKQENGVIDFDDMQMYMYMLLCHQKHPDVIRFCRDQWEYFFVDEFQDISKIQFEILRVLVTDPNKLIVIGDDDQCLVEGTLVHTPHGLKPIETLVEGEVVGTALGQYGYDFRPIDRISKKHVNETVYTVHTEHGFKLTATGNHIGFIKADNKENNAIVTGAETEVDMHLNMLGADSLNEKAGIHGTNYNSVLKINVDGKEQLNRVLDNIPNKVDAKFSLHNCPNETGYEVKVESSNVDILEYIMTSSFNELCCNDKTIVNIDRTAKLTDEEFKFIRFDEMRVGMRVPVWDRVREIMYDDAIIAIEETQYNGYVYDLSVPYTRNFTANGIIVHNCIYQWRGADPSIILNICGYYDIQKFVLSTNYRCGGEIVRHAATGIKNNANRSEKDMIPFNEGGKVKLYHSGSNDLFKMSKCAFDYVVNLIESGVNPSDVAILSRNNQHLAILNNMLLKEGYFSECTAEMQFTSIPIYKDIRMVMSLIEDTYDHNVIKKILWKVCPYLGIKGSTVIADIMNNTGCSVSSAIGFSIYNFTGRGRDIKFSDRINLGQRVHDNLRLRFNSVGNDSISGLIAIYKIIRDDENRESQLNKMLSMYITSVEFMYKSMDKARTLVGIVGYIKSLIRELGYDNAITHLNITERYESGKEKVLGNKITMSTMHSAKGKEWKYVVLFANDNITCPSFEGIGKMTEDGIELRDISGSIDENRRLSYVGMTRAKEELMIFTDKNNMSVYMLEALGVLKPNGFKNNQHIINLAIDGGLTKDLLDASKQFFKEDSPYYIDIKPVNKASDMI